MNFHKLSGTSKAMKNFPSSPSTFIFQPKKPKKKLSSALPKTFSLCLSSSSSILFYFPSSKPCKSRKRGFKCVLRSCHLHLQQTTAKQQFHIKNVGRHKNRFFCCLFVLGWKKKKFRGAIFWWKLEQFFCGFIIFIYLASDAVLSVFCGVVNGMIQFSSWFLSNELYQNQADGNFLCHGEIIFK